MLTEEASSGEFHREASFIERGKFYRGAFIGGRVLLSGVSFLLGLAGVALEFDLWILHCGFCLVGLIVGSIGERVSLGNGFHWVASFIGWFIGW